MGASLKPARPTRITGVTTEQQIGNGQPVVLMGIYPDAATAGTLTTKNGVGGTTVSVIGAGLPVAGVDYGTYGIEFPAGLTITPSSATDSFIVAWVPTL